MVSLFYDGGIHDRWMQSLEAQIFRHYGLEELVMNTHKHQYTCLATPPELEQFGLTHMVCRVDMQDRPVAAFNSSAAASIQCDSLNGFAQQDRPELDVDVEKEELAAANKAAEDRESQTANMSLAEKVALAQAAVATK